MQVPDVEQHPGGGRGQPAHEVAHGQRVVAQARRPRMDRGQVLDRDLHAKRVRPLEVAVEGAFLEASALAGTRAGRPAGVHEVQAVVGDELGARLRGVVEQSREGAVGLDRPRAEVVGGVQDQPQRARLERGAQRPGVAPAASPVGQHGRRRRVHLQPAHAGLLVRRQHAGRRPGVAMQVQAKAVVHPRSWFARGVRVLLPTGDVVVNRPLLRRAGRASRPGHRGRGGLRRSPRPPAAGRPPLGDAVSAALCHKRRADARPPTPAAATGAAPARSGRSRSSSARTG
jgi:hypothetical protein